MGAKPDSAGEELTRDVAAFVHETQASDLPDDVVALGKKSILDGLGLALSGSVAKSGEPGAPPSRRPRARRRAGHGDRHARCGWRRVSRPSPTASASTPTITTTRSSRSRPTASTASSPTRPRPPCRPRSPSASGRRRRARDVMLAYHLGVEVECKIAEAINPRHYQTGFHATATCGTFAAAAAGAKLMGLDAEATRARCRSPAASRRACARISAP